MKNHWRKPVINHKITCQIIEKLQERFSLPISICDLSGRTIASTEPSCIGEMNLLAIESLNLNARLQQHPEHTFRMPVQQFLSAFREAV